VPYEPLALERLPLVGRDARERAVAAAEVELAYRERRLLDREAALVVASQKVSAAVVEQLPQTTLPMDDDVHARVRDAAAATSPELAISRTRRRGIRGSP
jgi:hypothetical protein